MKSLQRWISTLVGITTTLVLSAGVAAAKVAPIEPEVPSAGGGTDGGFPWQMALTVSAAVLVLLAAIVVTTRLSGSARRSARAAKLA